MFLGYMVIIPDYFDIALVSPMTTPMEELIPFLKNHTDWEGKLRLDWEEKIHPYALGHGAKTFGTIGNLNMLDYKFVLF